MDAAGPIPPQTLLPLLNTRGELQELQRVLLLAILIRRR